MIAKLVNGNVVPCPRQGKDSSGKYHTNLPRFYENHLEIAADEGFYPVQYTEKPEGDYLATWELIDGVIVQIWVPYTPEPEPEDPVAARLDMIEECILEMSEIVYA